MMLTECQNALILEITQIPPPLSDPTDRLIPVGWLGWDSWAICCIYNQYPATILAAVTGLTHCIFFPYGGSLLAHPKI